MTARTILITGCSSGIGYTCAHGMQERGWRVLATVRNQADKTRLEAEGLETLMLDYADRASIAACADRAIARTGGKVDALFNNGAYGQPGAVEDLTPETLRAQLETNVIGWHDLTCRLVPSMRNNGFGRIVHCSSVLGLVALKWRGAYNASKFATEALGDTMRLELAGTGIHVCQIQPGPIRSRFPEHAIEALMANVDIEGSRHRDTYRRLMTAEKARLAKSSWGPERPEAARARTGRSLLPRYRLGPDAVLDALIHACESARPRPHYHVTAGTRAMAYARHLLPVRLLDILARRVS